MGSSKEINTVRNRQYSLATAKEFTKELVAATPSQRNWKGMIIAILVICAVCGLILFSIYLQLPPDCGPRVKGRKITLQDITSPHFVVPSFNGSWISENELLFRDALGGLSVLNADTLITEPFVANTTFRQLNSNNFAVSPDRKYILFIHDSRPVWRYSTLAKYTLYDIKNEFKIPLNPPGESGRENEQAELQLVQWGPRENSLLFVYKNDLYYRPTVVSLHSSRITKTGKPNVIYNGIPDFLYEEEVLKSNSAASFSPNGNFLLYVTFNDTRVGEYTYPWYGFGNGNPYPQIRSLRYPKAGTANPEVIVWAVDLRSNPLVSFPIAPPAPLDPNDHYFAGARWINNDEIALVWMNRRQNHSIISRCSSSKWNCQEIYTLKNAGTGWLDYPDPPIFSENGSSCLLRVPWLDGDSGLFHHIVWLDLETRKEIPITQGPFEVTSISAWDQLNKTIYFIGVPIGEPGQRHLYRIPEKPLNSTVVLSPFCVTCPPEVTNTSDMNELKGGREEVTVVKNESETVVSTEDIKPVCLYNQIIFSPKSRFFVLECLGPKFPATFLHSVQNGGFIYLDNRTALRNEVANMGLPKVLTIQVEVAGGYQAPVRLHLPPGLKEDEEFKFPLLLHVSGGPGSQSIDEKFGLSWASYLTSERNFIVVEIDARGSGFQGENVRHSVYRKLGNLEVSDHLEVMRYLVKHLHFINTENMAIWGWNYGGYIAAKIFAEDNEETEPKKEKLFKCAIIVAPITKLEFYNTAYIEKYMGLPNYTDNYKGYEESDLTQISKKLKDKQFHIIHGTADERVHHQHSLYFTKSLVHEGIIFTEQIYPDEGSRLEGVKEHFYRSMEAFLDKSLEEMDFEDYDKANFLGFKL